MERHIEWIYRELSEGRNRISKENEQEIEDNCETHEKHRILGVTYI